MRWPITKEPDTTVWHKWFAWHPVKAHASTDTLLNSHWIWLETVWRRHAHIGAYYYTEYRANNA